MGQHAVKFAKDIRSDRDILEEELIKPSSHKPTTVPQKSDDSTIEDKQTPEQVSVPQLIKYKQQIHLEHDRRIHREKLADLAKSIREKESFIQSDLAAKPEEIQRQHFEDHQTSSHVVPTDENAAHVHVVASKEEEDILDDENIFGPRRQRDRASHRKRLSPSHAHTPRTSRQVVPVLGTSVICKACGNRVNVNDNPPIAQPLGE